MDDYTITVEQEVTMVRVHSPHVVILGAGASRASCPNGDKYGKALPLMQDFAEKLGITTLLQNWGINPNQNFENIFSDLHESGELTKCEEIELIVSNYFDQLELPDVPTIYDHLVLSLRETDVIATFNWDPFLIQAYRRNVKSGLRLPNLLFLHGNVRAAYCKADEIRGIKGLSCQKCGEQYQASPLLFPIRNKDYASDYFISSEWSCLKSALKQAFMITIFGYAGPRTDVEAIAAMKEAWGDVNQRYMEQTAFITLQTDEEITEHWQQFIHTHHYEVQNDFYDSWIAKHPRRTGEAYFNQYYDAKFIDDNPIPKNLDFPQLWEWYEQFKAVEDAAEPNA